MKWLDRAHNDARPGRDPWVTDAERRIVDSVGGRAGMRHVVNPHEPPPGCRWLSALLVVAPALTIAAVVALLKFVAT